MLINQVYPCKHMCYVIYIVSGSALGTIFYSLVGNPNRKKMHIFGFVGIFEYIC